MLLLLFSSLGFPAEGNSTTDSIGLDHIEENVAIPEDVRSETKFIASSHGAFVPNKGQFPDHVRYNIVGVGVTAFLTETSIVFLTTEDGQIHQRVLLQSDDGFASDFSNGWAVSLEFQDSEGGSSMRGLEQKQGKHHYFIGSDPDEWIKDVPLYGKVIVQDVWPNVDVVWYISEDQHLKFDFIVRPGANPDDVSFSVEGAKDLLLDKTGDLVIKTPYREIVKEAPYTYQEDGSTRWFVESAYDFNGDGTIRFELDEYDPSSTLVIDPVIYSTYLGGSGPDRTYSSDIDSDGNMFVTGSANSGFPTTPGSFQPNYPGTTSVVISKFSSDGSNLVYSTFIGGNAFERSVGIVIDDKGRAHITGITESSNYPVTGDAYQSTCTCSQGMGFITTLSANGVNLEYSSFFGGTDGRDSGTGIEVDIEGNLYIAGTTGSTDFPLFNPFQPLGPILPGVTDAFVAKFSSTRDLVYSTYLGGHVEDEGRDIAVDALGNAYVTGTTPSIDFPITWDSAQPVYGGAWDAFVTKFNPMGGLEYSTYLGGEHMDKGVAIAVDSEGRAYVTGNTQSEEFPVKDAYQSSKPGNFAAYITRISPSGVEFDYSTYLGGRSADAGADIEVDALGKMYVIGSTWSPDFPITPGAIQVTHPGGISSSFLSKINENGNTIEYSTYYGGSDSEIALGLATSLDGFIYFSGYTESADIPTVNAYQPNFGGWVDGFAVKLRNLQVEQVLGSSFINTRPECAGRAEKCDHLAFGYYDRDTSDPVNQFEIDLGNFDSHQSMECAADGSCGYWVKLGIEVDDDVLVLDGLEVMIGSLYWQRANGTWAPDEGIDVSMTIRHDPATSTTWLEPMDETVLPIDAFEDAHPESGFVGNTLTMRFDPTDNPWASPGVDWDAVVEEAQVQLVARPVIMLHGWTADAHADDYTFDPGIWQSEFIDWIEDQAADDFGQNPWAVFGSDGLTWFSYHKKQDFRDSSRQGLNGEIQKVRASGYGGKVDLIAHSMGGLVSRHFVEEADGLGVIEKVVTVVTPHLGSAWADAYVVATDRKQADGTPDRDRYYIGNDQRNVGRYAEACFIICFNQFLYWRSWWQDSIQANRFHADPSQMEPVMADFELKKPFGSWGNPILDRLNREVGADGVEYLFIAASTKFGKFTWGDGIVSKKSALLKNHEFSCNKHFEIDEAPIVAHEKAPQDIQTKTWTYNFIVGVDSPCGTSSMSLSSATTSGTGTDIFSMGPSSVESWPAAGVAGFSQPVTRFSWNVSTLDQASLEVLVENDTLPGATFKLIAPDGRQEGFGGSSISEADWSRSEGDDVLDLLAVQISDPENGTWTLEISGIPGESIIGGQSFLESPYSFEVEYDPPAVVLEPIEFSAIFMENGLGIGGVDVNATIHHLEYDVQWDLDFEEQQVNGETVYLAEFTPVLPGPYRLMTEAVSAHAVRNITLGVPVLAHGLEAEDHCLVSDYEVNDFLADSLTQCVEGSTP